MNAKKDQYTFLIKQKAEKFGFQSCGISKADFLESEALHLDKYLKSGFHGEMAYMENYFDKRLDPRLLVEGSRSVISLTYNYFPKQLLNENDNYKISKYAYGEDYHDVVKSILKEMVLELKEEIGHFSCRVFVDSAPVLERAWAKKSGLGWIGKNGNLISKKTGSFFFLAEIICDLHLEYDAPITDHCGNCRKCIDACPTGAIVGDKIVDGSKCISYATIELKNQISDYFKDKMQDWIFGCDVCQDVCPWNRFSKAHHQKSFEPNERLREMNKSRWEEISQEEFKSLFPKSAVKRTKHEGLLRNIKFVKKK